MSRPDPTRLPPAFTLIELLVSMTVLVIIVLLSGQMVNSASTLTGNSTRHLDADGQARLVFQRLGDDLSRMVNRPDADCIFAKVPLSGGTGSASGGNDDKMFFYSEAPAYFDASSDAKQAALKSPVALVGYRINNGFQLERLGKRLTWDGPPTVGAAPGGVVFLASNATANPLTASTLGGNWPDTLGKSIDTPPYSAGTDDADYNVLGEQVFRLEFCYMLQPAPHKDTDGTMRSLTRYSTLPVTAPENVTNKLDATRAPAPTDDVSAGFQSGSRWYDTADSRAYACTSNASGHAAWKILGVRDLAGIVVTIGVLDPASRAILPTFNAKISSSQTQALAFPDVRKLNAALADAIDDNAKGDLTVPDLSTTSPRLPATAWRNAINQPNFAQTAGIPVAAVGQIRIYQRCLSLNNSP